MAYPIKSVYLSRTTKTSFHTFIRVRKEVFRLFRNYCGLLDRNQIVRHQRILNLDGNRAVVIALCQSCEEGLPPQSIVAAAFCLHSSRAIMIGSPPLKNTWLGSRSRPRRALRYRLPDDMPDRRLETTFSLFYLRNLDKTAVLRYDKYRNPNAPQPYFLSFGEIHISQAQVSRLEKGALEHIRKQI